MHVTFDETNISFKHCDREDDDEGSPGTQRNPAQEKGETSNQSLDSKSKEEGSDQATQMILQELDAYNQEQVDTLKRDHQRIPKNGREHPTILTNMSLVILLMKEE